MNSLDANVNEIVNRDNLYKFAQTVRSDCPGIHCLENSFDFQCGKISGVASWLSIPKGLKELCPVHFSKVVRIPTLNQAMHTLWNHNPGESTNEWSGENLVFDDKGDLLARGAIEGIETIRGGSHPVDCQKALNKFYQDWSDSLPDTIRKYKEEIDNPFLNPSSPPAGTFNFYRAGGYVLVGALCAYGLWKCYQNRDKIAAGAKNLFNRAKSLIS